MAAEPGRLPGLDGVRGLAVALVVVHHVVVRDPDAAIKGAWISVDLFFVLSGFLITMSMIQHRDLGDFLRRRFWRVVPAMTVFLAAYSLWSLAQDDAAQRLDWSFAAATQWANVQGAIGPPFSPHIGHLWSLSAEVQFYVVWGVGLWWLLRARVPRAAILAGLCALFLLSWAERALLLDGAAWNRLYLGPDTRAAALLVGCIIGIAHASGWLRARWLLGVLTIPAAAFMVWVIADLTFLEDRTYRWVLTAAALSWGVVVAASVLRLPTPLRPVLESAPLVFLGRISYSVYLWHLLLIAEVARRYPGNLVTIAAIGIPLSVAVGGVSYALVERPFLTSTGRARLRARLG